MDNLYIRLFGILELCYGDNSHSQPVVLQARSFLAYLIYHHDQFIPRQRLLGIFWGEQEETQARRALSHALWQIRQHGKALAERLITESDALSFRLQEEDVLDVERFEARCRPTSPPAPLAERIHRLEEAVTLYRADLLEDIYDDWVLLERERLRERYLQALETLTMLNKQRGSYEIALNAAQRLVAADPLRESAHREVMRLYHLLGRPRAALHQYQRLRATLTEELNTQPTARTRTLCKEIAATLDDASAPYLPIEVTPPLMGNLSQLPFVGRREERRQILNTLKAALRGHGGLTIVRGAAGVGKSRLVRELVADAEWRGFQVGLAKVSPLGAVPPYQLLRAALSALLTPLRLSQLAEIVEAQRLSALAPLFPPLREQLPDLPQLPPLDLHAEWQRLWDALGHTLHALASITPLLLVLEDVHWADNASLAALPHLAAHLTDAPLMLLLTSRIVEAHERPLVLETLETAGQNAPLTRITLPPFNASEIHALIQRALALRGNPVASGTFVASLEHATGGNALHLVESLKLLLEQGALIQKEDGHWHIQDASTSLETPTSVKALIAERVARLPATTRAVLELVAVLGEHAEFSALSATAIAPIQDLLGHLEQLEKRGFLRQQEKGYRFEHDLLQDAVYAGLPADRRRALHQQAAVTLEALYPDRIEALAYHFWAGELWDKAATYNRRAGQQAHAAYAGTEALMYYERALTAWARQPAPEHTFGLRLYQERGKVNDDLGYLDKAEKDCQDAYALAEQLGDVVAQAKALNALAYLHHQRGDFTNAELTALQAQAKAETANRDVEIALSLFHLANAVRNQGRYPEALHNYQRAIATFEALDDKVRLADALNRMGYALELTGRYAEAREVIERSLLIRRQLGDKIGIAYSLINLFAHHYYHANFDEGFSVAREALEICQAIGHPSGETAAQLDLGIAALEKGEWEIALSHLERSRRMAQGIGDLAVVANAWGEMGRLLYFRGDLKRAREKLEEAHTLLKTSNEEHQMSGVLAPLAQVCLGLGEIEQAQVHAQAALDIAERQQSPWNVALAHRVQGEVKAAVSQETGRIAEHFETSIRIFREIESSAEMARSMATYAEYLLRPGATAAERERALSLTEQARAIYQKKGMQADLRRLADRLVSHRQPAQIHIRLARRDMPIGRPLTDNETVEITWSVAAPTDDEIDGKVARRRHRIRRLLREASQQGAEATVNDLAQALDVSTRTIKRDLAALRAAGHEIATRGSREF